jgi:Molybdopterin oxidoreductase
MAEAHPVGFRWVMKAKERGARVIHVDPRYGRTSQMADLYVPIRAGTDVAFLGGIIRHVIETGSYFKEYVVRVLLQGVRRQLHERVRDRRRELSRYRGLGRRVLGLRPRDRNIRPDLVDVRGL